MTSLDEVTARNIAGLRQERGWQQRDLARAMSACGMKWTPNRVSQIETLRRSLTNLELLTLLFVFAVPLERLLEGEGDIELPSGEALPLARLRGLATGAEQLAEVERRRVDEDESAIRFEDLRKLSAGLGLDPITLDFLAHQEYGRGFIEERDRRAGVGEGLSERSARAHKAHASKAMLREIEEAMKGTKKAALKLKAAAWALNQGSDQ